MNGIAEVDVLLINFRTTMVGPFHSQNGTRSVLIDRHTPCMGIMEPLDIRTNTVCEILQDLAYGPIDGQFGDPNLVIESYYRRRFDINRLASCRSVMEQTINLSFVLDQNGQHQTLIAQGNSGIGHPSLARSLAINLFHLSPHFILKAV